MTESIAAALAEDLDAAFPRLRRTHAGAVYSTLLRLSGHADEAEELSQDTFVRAYAALRGYPAERIRALRTRAWLVTIAVNLQRNAWRSAARRPATVALDGAPGSALVDPGESPEAAAERREGERRLAAALRLIPEPHRVAVVLRHVTGLGYAEIAAAVGCPVGTAKARAWRGVRQVRALLTSPAPPPAHPDRSSLEVPA